MDASCPLIGGMGGIHGVGVGGGGSLNCTVVHSLWGGGGGELLQGQKCS